ncbi:MAG: hypothetical protein NZT92_15900 [Abditibacteriales bacterium]|nr:hypothetical protein [Abditibacteriales bacterium]MDW8367414.1 hypothetical protein [Abditibacteriales bacterium]
MSGVTAGTQAAAGTPVTPPVVQAPATQGRRVQEDLVPLVESGKKYVGLTTAADLMIQSADLMRFVCYVLAGLAFVSMLMWLRESLALGFLIGMLAAGVIALIGWLMWLWLTVWGELMYVVMDVEENLRRRG